MNLSLCIPSPYQFVLEEKPQDGISFFLLSRKFPADTRLFSGPGFLQAVVFGENIKNLMSPYGLGEGDKRRP